MRCNDVTYTRGACSLMTQISVVTELPGVISHLLMKYDAFVHMSPQPENRWAN